MRDDILDFLCVDDFLRTLVDARALKTAFELGLVDLLLDRGLMSHADLEQSLGLDAVGFNLLLGMLNSNSVTRRQDDGVALHPDFLLALGYRDLLESRLDFCGLIMNDFADLFTTLVKDPAEFMGSAKLFELFDYRRCFEYSEENYARTRGWMGLTTALTRYEAGVCNAMHNFGSYRRMLDIGGNSGEFVLQLCRRNAQLNAAVMDLPLVCEIGMEHVLGESEHTRIGFHKADLRIDDVPPGYDLISFKSMLHDWPEAEALGFLEKAAEALEPGGSLMIFERLPIELADSAPDFSLLPILLFFRSYRSPQIYIERLEALGFENIQRREIDLDTRFVLLTASKPVS